MILTTPERPIWRIAYIDPEEEGDLTRSERRAVMYTDYLEVTEDLIIYGRSVSVIGGEKWGDADSAERTVIERRHLLFMDYAQYHDDIWSEFWEGLQ